jgi:pimeloyl-ACP methyl ester carboxylesterase
MSAAGTASLRAAVAGRAAKQRYEATSEVDDDGFTSADLEALEGDWSWFLDVVRPALAAGPGPLVDDDLATVGPWGFDVTRIGVPVLLLHGGEDRIAPVAHASWIAAHCPTATLRISPTDGHVSVMRFAAAPALDHVAGNG